MPSKTHQRRVLRAKRAITKAMRAEGLDPTSHADHMKMLSALHDRVVGNKPKVST